MIKYIAIGAGERKRLREWLIDMIDSNTVHGLRWLDGEHKTFRITWKHAGKPDFELEKDAVLFREWAKHTGKYKVGDQPDPSTWKTRFRCALHKMPDVEEVKVPHSLDHPTEPYRVFKLLPKTKGSQSPKRNSVSPKPGSPKSPTGRCHKDTSQRPQSNGGAMFGSIASRPATFYGDQTFITMPDQRYQSDAITDDRCVDLESITPTLGLYPSDYAEEVTVSTCTSPVSSSTPGFGSQGGHFTFPDNKHFMNTVPGGNPFAYGFYPSFSIANKQDNFTYPGSGNLQASADLLKLEISALLGFQADM